MSIFLYDDDPRRLTAADYHYNKGSFAQITDGINAELARRGLLGDEKSADWIGFASGLKLDFGFHEKRRFLINVWETNKLPYMFVEWRRKTTTKVFGLSKQISDVWESYGFPTPIVDIGVDPDFWKPMPDAKKFDKFTVLSVTSCNFRSGIPELLAAFNLAFRGDPDVQLIIKNTDERASKLPDIVSSMRDVSVIYDCKRIHAFELRELMARSHILSYNPLNTSAGLPIIEAGAMELPVLTCDYCPTNIYPTCEKIKCVDRSISEIKSFVCRDFGLPYTFPDSMIDESRAIMHCPDIMDFASKLVRMRAHYDEVKASANAVRSEVLGNWTWAHSCDQLLGELK